LFAVNALGGGLSTHKCRRRALRVEFVCLCFLALWSSSGRKLVGVTRARPPTPSPNATTSTGYFATRLAEELSGPRRLTTGADIVDRSFGFMVQDFALATEPVATLRLASSKARRRAKNST
jgi:hypothetical protein